MQHTRHLAYITLADFVVRAAYQMGKTPLLPIFALSLGATEAYLGFIVSVSTVTGMLLKPAIGLLSDRWGRRGWLLTGTVFFTVFPFLYKFIETPEQLLTIRLLHGMATAIYGPVTLAYVAEQFPDHRAERLGWFSMARSAGYIVGPAVAGWLLLTWEPTAVFTAIGLLSSVAFLPMLLLPESHVRPSVQRPLGRETVTAALSAAGRSSGLWLAGALEAMMYIALYGIKAFLPVYSLTSGVSVALIGSFFAIQEGTHLLLKPWGGRLGDRLGYCGTIAIGLVGLGTALVLITSTQTGVTFIVPAILMGLSQALVVPAMVALVSTQVQQEHLGTGMGLIGTLKNAGKVAGPIIAGVLIQQWDFSTTFHLVGVALLCGAVAVWCVSPPTSSARSALASWRSAVSNPSVNQP